MLLMPLKFFAFCSCITHSEDVMQAVPSGSYTMDKIVPFPSQQHFDSTHIAALRSMANQQRTLLPLSPFLLGVQLGSLAPAGLHITPEQVRLLLFCAPLTDSQSLGSALCFLTKVKVVKGKSLNQIGCAAEFSNGHHKNHNSY